MPPGPIGTPTDEPSASAARSSASAPERATAAPAERRGTAAWTIYARAGAPGSPSSRIRTMQTEIARCVKKFVNLGTSMSTSGVRPTLPGRDYHAPEVFELERERIFFREWMYVARSRRGARAGRLRHRRRRRREPARRPRRRTASCAASTTSAGTAARGSATPRRTATRRARSSARTTRGATPTTAG